MNNGKININISGGTSNIGNVSQGDNNTNTVKSQSINLEADAAFLQFFENLHKNSISAEISEERISELQAEVELLKQSMAAGSTSEESLTQIAKNLYEKYGWAGDALKKLFTVIAVLV